MKNYNAEYIEKDAEFKYSGISLYFCVFSLFILVTAFMFMIVNLEIYHTEDFIKAFFIFVPFIVVYFIVGSKSISFCEMKYIFKKCFEEIQETETQIEPQKMNGIISKRQFGHYICEQVDGTIYVSKQKINEYTYYKQHEITLNNQKIYFLEAIKKEKQTTKVYLPELITRKIFIKAP